MPGKYPPALQERDFVVPGEGYMSHDGRRNLTDLQETSQWLGGPAVAKAIIAGLLGYLGPHYVDKISPTHHISHKGYFLDNHQVSQI